NASVTFPGGMQLRVLEALKGAPNYVEYTDAQSSFEVDGAAGIRPLGTRRLAALLLVLQTARDNDTMLVLPSAHREERIAQLADESGVPLAELKFLVSQFDNLNRVIEA